VGESREPAGNGGASAGGAGARVRIDVAAELRLFLAPRERARGRLWVAHDGTSSLGHVIESAGVPLPEVGELAVGGRRVSAAHRPAGGEAVRVLAVARPQPVPDPPPRFVLDVHLGTLARRLRLVGVDAAYGNSLDDDTLLAWANRDHRVLLTQDRGLLRRRKLWLGAYVRGARPDDQFVDVLDRFAPPLAPWSRCTACNGPLAPVRKTDVERLLPEGTRRTYETFARCQECGRLYWPGAHRPRLEAIVATAVQTVAAARSAATRGARGARDAGEPRL
jgi:uncharacterized protein